MLARQGHLSVLKPCAPPQQRRAARGKQVDSQPQKQQKGANAAQRSRVTARIARRPSNATQMAQQTPTSNSAKALRARGDQVWARMPKCNAEFFRLTYGALVVQLVEDCDDTKEVNDKLLSMGVSIGTRIIDEFLAKSNQREPCKSFEETCETIGRVAFKMFLGVEADVRNWNEDKSRCSLVFPENPLNENVELPPGQNFLYSNIICGAIRGALEQILYKVDVYCVKDTLRGDDTNEIGITFVSRLQAEMDDQYKES